MVSLSTKQKVPRTKHKLIPGTPNDREMGEIILWVDPREKMASDYWTKGVHFETATKWQTLCGGRHIRGVGREKGAGKKRFLLCKKYFNQNRCSA